MRSFGTLDTIIPFATKPASRCRNIAAYRRITPIFSNVQGIIKMRMLPTIQLFKIGVKLDMVEGEKHEVKPSEKKKEIDHVEFIPTEEDKEFVRHLQKDLEVTDRPFLKAAESLGITEDQIFERLAHYEKIGVMRRYAAILRHRDAGFVANGMIVWKVPKERISEVGETLGAFPQVSHCYERFHIRTGHIMYFQ